MIVRYILFLVVFSWQIFVKAQTIQKISSYTKKDGLYNNAVIGITKDVNDFFWIGSYNYLQRWNGNIFYSNPIEISTAYLKDEGEKKQFISFGGGIESNLFSTDATSKLYISRFSEKLTPTIPNNLQNRLELVAIKDFYKKQGNDSIYNLLDKKVQRAHKTRDGFVLECYDRSLYYIDKRKGLKSINNYLLKGSGYTCMTMGNRVVVYQRRIGRYKVLLNDSIINVGKLKIEMPLTLKGISANQKLGEFSYITFTDGVLRKFELQKNDSITVTDLLVLKDYEIYSCFYFDESNNTLYLGTLTGGFSAYRISSKNFRLIQSLSLENYVYTHHICNNKLTTNIEFYLKYQKKEGHGWNWGLTSAFCPIENTNFFYSAYSNLYTIKNKKCNIQKIAFSTKPLQHFVTSDSVIYCSRQAIDKYYIATNTYKSGNPSEWPTYDKQLYTIAKSSYPNIIYAVIGDALQALNMNTHTTVTLAKGITGEPRSIDTDSSNNGLFISTKYEGCYYYKNNYLTKLPFQFINKPFNSHYVLTDKEGDYWLPTNEGLFFMLKNDFIDYLTQKKNIIQFKRFGKEDGILNEEFNGGFQNAGLLFNDSIYMGTMAGTLVFHPSIKYIKKSLKGKLVLDYIKLDSIDITNTENIELPPNFKQFNIRADYPFIYNNGNVEYRLLGSNDTLWHNLSNNGLLEIKTLEAGSYKIEIRPSIDYNKIIKIPFKVKPYWYNTWLAYTIFFILFLTGIYIIFMWRWQTYKNKNLELLNNSRNNLFETIAHDLRSPINSYIGLADDIKYLIKTRNFDSIDNLGNAMDEKSRNLSLLVSNVLNWSRGEKGLVRVDKQSFKVVDILNEILPIYLDIAGFRGISINENVPSDATIESDRYIYSHIIRNLVDNAIKYSKNGSLICINFNTTKQQNTIEITNPIQQQQIEKLSLVSDIFKGIKKGEPHSDGLGLGIFSIYNSCKLLNGTIELKIENSVASFKLILTT